MRIVSQARSKFLPDPYVLTGAPSPPVMWLHGRRIEVGAVRFTGSGWLWERHVNRNRRPSHWYHQRGGWVLSQRLFDQICSWAATICYCDELSGCWRIPAEEVRGGKEILILGVPHFFISAEHWTYEPPAGGEQLPLALDEVGA